MAKRHKCSYTFLNNSKKHNKGTYCGKWCYISNETSQVLCYEHKRKYNKKIKHISNYTRSSASPKRVLIPLPEVCSSINTSSIVSQEFGKDTNNNKVISGKHDTCPPSSEADILFRVTLPDYSFERCSLFEKEFSGIPDPRLPHQQYNYNT